MRILADIVEDCKCNKRPDYEELRYALLVYSFMLNMDHRVLRECLTSEKEMAPIIKKMRAENSFNMYHTALNKSPKEYLGWNNDPENPEYQKFHEMGSKLVDKIIAKRESENK